MLFYYNAFNVISDGLDTRVGTITSDFESVNSGNDLQDASVENHIR